MYENKFQFRKVVEKHEMTPPDLFLGSRTAASNEIGHCFQIEHDRDPSESAAASSKALNVRNSKTISRCPKGLVTGRVLR